MNKKQLKYKLYFTLINLSACIIICLIKYYKTRRNMLLNNSNFDNRLELKLELFIV